MCALWKTVSRWKLTLEATKSLSSQKSICPLSWSTLHTSHLKSELNRKRAQSLLCVLQTLKSAAVWKCSLSSNLSLTRAVSTKWPKSNWLRISTSTSLIHLSSLKRKSLESLVASSVLSSLLGYNLKTKFLINSKKSKKASFCLRKKTIPNKFLPFTSVLTQKSFIRTQTALIKQVSLPLIWDIWWTFARRLL
jgi:hypothetical protein